MLPDICIAKIALLNEQGEVLLLRRTRDASIDTIRRGEFDLPGGRAEKGEPCGRAVIRETEE